MTNINLFTTHNKQRLMELMQSDTNATATNETDFSAMVDPDLDGAEASAKAYCIAKNEGRSGRVFTNYANDPELEEIRKSVKDFLKGRRQYIADKDK